MAAPPVSPPGIQAPEADWAHLQPGVLLQNRYLTLKCIKYESDSATEPRMIVALESTVVTSDGAVHKLARGDFVVIAKTSKYTVQSSGLCYEAVIAADHPRGLAAPAPNPPKKNHILYDSNGFYVYEEALLPGDSRPEHTHNTRLTIVINATTLQGEGGQKFGQVPNAAKFIGDWAKHSSLKNVGSQPLRNIVLEFKS